ncbi:2260_t:CDS:2, partial [Racocetra persica]
MSKNYDFFLRIGVDGERDVGKSWLIEKFAGNDFENGEYEENLHVYVTTTYIHLDNCTVKVEFLETGWNMRPNINYYSYIDGAMLVYDISDGLKKIEELSREYTNTDSNYVTDKIPIMIIANKWDENEHKNEDDLLKEIKNSVGEEFLCNITSTEEKISKISSSFEEILKKCKSRLLDFREVNDLHILTSPSNQFNLMMKRATQLYGIPKKVIDDRRKQLEILNEEMDG